MIMDLSASTTYSVLVKSTGSSPNVESYISVQSSHLAIEVYLLMLISLNTCGTLSLVLLAPNNVYFLNPPKQCSLIQRQPSQLYHILKNSGGIKHDTMQNQRQNC